MVDRHRSVRQTLPTALYLLLVMGHLAPVWGAKWFVTLDGPCHLANARHLLDLLQGSSFVHTYLKINIAPAPYWSGQLLMAGLFTIAPAWLVEKITFTLAIAGTAWAFHRLVMVAAPGRGWAILLGLPFLLHFGIGMGFINFSLSLPLLLIALRWALLRTQGRHMGSIGPTFLFTLLYFTHPSTFLVAVVSTFVLLIFSRFNPKEPATSADLRVWLVASIPGGLMLIHYLAGQPAGSSAMIGAVDTRLDELWQGRVWNALGAPGELPLSIIKSLILILLGIVTTTLTIRNWKRELAPWIILTGGGLLGFMILPDVMAGGSHASGRILLFSMIFLILLLIISDLPRWIHVTGGLSMALVCIAHLPIHFRSHTRLADDADIMLNGAHPVPEKAVVLPLNYSTNWMHSNLSSYIAAVHGSVVLDNFVATAPFAPVQWHARMAPGAEVFDTNRYPCPELDAYERTTGRAVTHVLVWDLDPDPDVPCTANMLQALRPGTRGSETGTGPVGWFDLTSAGSRRP